jgi:hypothetical protein
MWLLGKLLQIWSAMLRWLFIYWFWLKLYLWALLTFAVVTEWGCYWSYSVPVPWSGNWVKLWLFFFLQFSFSHLLRDDSSFFSCQVSYMTGKLLLKLESVKFIIANHSVKSPHWLLFIFHPCAQFRDNSFLLYSSSRRISHFLQNTNVHVVELHSITSLAP